VVHGPRSRKRYFIVYVRDAAARSATPAGPARRGGHPARFRRSLHGAVLNPSPETLATIYGTPLLVIDLDAVDATLSELVRCATDFGVEVSYAAKAFATVEFLRYLARYPIGVDVCSLGELVTAQRAGFESERITLHGAGKSDEELTAACTGEIGCIAVDGIAELQRLAEISRDGHTATVMLRLNVGVDASTHAFVRTGGKDSKFGIHPRDERAAASLLSVNPQLRFAGVHAHIGSQIYDESAYLENASALVAAAERLAAFGLQSERVVIGGGFGVPSDPKGEHERLDVTATIAAAASRVRSAAQERGLGIRRLGIEPGRAIVADAGTTLYRVLAVKRQSHRTFVVVDGGIAENPRPALYGARYHVTAVTPRHEEDQEITLCGRSCENDELGTMRLPRDVGPGDLLAMHSTGAYTYSMAGNYNRFPKPAVVAIASGTHRLLARRETIEDVLRNDAV
jgi:diaminopimelate decarboxylase